MKINRLVEIMVILLNKKQVTSKELAERFDVSTRTIYRDIDVLSSAGVPIYMNRGKAGGISLLEHYTVNKTVLSKDEKESLLFALKTLEATKQVDIEPILEKLNGLFHDGIKDYIEVDFSWWGEESHIDDKFELIKQSIIAEQHITFEYTNSTNEKAIRRVAPYKIFYKGQAWYLSAYCLEKEAFRIFRLTRIRRLQVLESKFCRDQLEVYDTKKIAMTYREETFKLKFKANMYYRILDSYEERAIHENEDGTYTVTLRCPYDEWIYSHILSYGDSVEVLSPQWFKEEVVSRVKNILEVYKI